MRQQPGDSDAVEPQGEDVHPVIDPVRNASVLDEFIARIADENRHGEADWGPLVGREV